MRPGSRDAVQPEAKQKVTTLFIFQFPRTLLSRILMGMSVQIRRGHNELARKTAQRRRPAAPRLASYAY